MFKLTTLITTVIISLLAQRGIRCIEEKLGSMARPSRLATEYASSFVVVESLLIAFIVVVEVRSYRSHMKPRHDWSQMALMAMQVYAMIGVAGLVITVLDPWLVIGLQP